MTSRTIVLALSVGLSLGLMLQPLSAQSQQPEPDEHATQTLRLSGTHTPHGEASGSIDFHARVQHMGESEVQKTPASEAPLSYRFGGTSLDVGVTMQMGW